MYTCNNSPENVEKYDQMQRIPKSLNPFLATSRLISISVGVGGLCGPMYSACLQFDWLMASDSGVLLLKTRF